ncbi:flavodoxin family protein [Algoriphagus namhaensis]
MRGIGIFIILFLLIVFVGQENAFPQETSNVLIAYYSKSGNTAALAQNIAEGAKSVEGVSVKLLAIDQIKQTDLLQADAIILGSPVYNANVAPPMQEFINSWPFENRPLEGKIGAAFTTGGGISIGEEGVMLSLIQSMLIHGMIIMGGDTTESAFGASAITGEGPFQDKALDPIFLAKGFGLGKRVAEWTLKLQ